MPSRIRLWGSRFSPYARTSSRLDVLQMRRNLTLVFLAGLAVVLPGVLLLMVMQWLFLFFADLLDPVTQLVSQRAGLHRWLALIAVITLLLAACLTIGLAVRTRVGRWLHDVLEGTLARVVPGYRITRDLVRELLGGHQGARVLSGEVALARIHGQESPVRVTAIVTSRHADGSYTVYVPTAPFPTSGFVYHLPADCVEILAGVSVEAALRTVISCGAGSAEILAGIQVSAGAAADRESETGPGSRRVPDPAAAAADDPQ